MLFGEDGELVKVDPPVPAASTMVKMQQRINGTSTGTHSRFAQYHGVASFCLGGSSGRAFRRPRRMFLWDFQLLAQDQSTSMQDAVRPAPRKGWLMDTL